VVVVDNGIVAAGGRVREPRSGEGTHGGAWEELEDAAAGTRRRREEDEFGRTAAEKWGGFM
jgi:hypothetical protein